MKYLFVLTVILCGVSYTLTSESNGTFGENIDGEGLLKLGRKLHKPMLTLIGMAIKNVLPCGEWTPWSSCDASKRGYFGSQTRTRSCTSFNEFDKKTTTTDIENKICEGQCPISYNLTKNGLCLKLNSTFVSNEDAAKQCQLEGAYLIHIDTQQKYDDVKSMLSGFSSNVHIDGRRTNSTSPWEYRYGNQRGFLKWHSGYPKNEAHRLCLLLQINSKNQFDYNCSYKQPFICEILPN